MPAFGVPFSDLSQGAQDMAYELSRRSDSELVATARGDEGAMAASRQWLEDAHFHVRDNGELRSLASHAEKLRRNRLDPIPTELFDYFGYSEPYDEQDLYSNHNLAHRKDAMTTNSKSGRRPNRSASRKRAYSAADREIERYYHEVLENPYSEDAKWLSDPAFDAELSAREIVDEGILQDFTEDSFDYLVQTLQDASDLYKEEHEASYRPRSASRRNHNRRANRKQSFADFGSFSDAKAGADAVVNEFGLGVIEQFENLREPGYTQVADWLFDQGLDESGVTAVFDRLRYDNNFHRFASLRNRKANMTTTRNTVAARKARAAALRRAANQLDSVSTRSASLRKRASDAKQMAKEIIDLVGEDAAIEFAKWGGNPDDVRKIYQEIPDMMDDVDLDYEARSEILLGLDANDPRKFASRRSASRHTASERQKELRRRAALRRAAAMHRRAADGDAEDDFDWEEKAEEREEDEAEKEARIARRTAAIVLRSLRRQASVTRRAADVALEDAPEDLPEVDENEQPTEADDDTAHSNGVVNTVPQTDESGVDEPTAAEDPLEPVSAPDPDEARQASRRPVRLSGRTASAASDDTALL